MKDPKLIQCALQRAAQGDEKAWAELVAWYERLLWSVARGYRLCQDDVEEVCQLTWIRLSERLGQIREPAKLAGWLATVARREAMRLAMDRNAVPVEDTQLESLVAEPVEPPEFLHSDRNRQLWLHFHALSERCQHVLRLLMYSPEASYADMGRSMGLPVGSVGPTKTRCLRTLARKLTKAEVI
ncbi:sigma-70 family RNA polymerase sigma factor [Pseudonocardiaceae bacterium YIM PH 21723]|nr:sigma-70 family RNA polymerase sigma factor [Pseudonocardiaceae bacterium YIM PH 21723]